MFQSRKFYVNYSVMEMAVQYQVKKITWLISVVFLQSEMMKIFIKELWKC